MNKSEYYSHTRYIGLTSKVSLYFRTKMFLKFLDTMKPYPNYKILDVGVTCDDYPDSNYFEKIYPYKDKIVCVGTEDGSHLEEKFPGLKFIKVNSGEPLPFSDNEFDISFCNAVIEHVGNTESQMTFVREIIRVSKNYFITTPNRWFPIEYHTRLPFLHWLPQKLYREILSILGEKYLNKEENLNLLSKHDFERLFPKDEKIMVESVGLFGYPTNLMIYNKNN